MRLIFDHIWSIQAEGFLPLMALQAVREGETAREMFETGWVPFYRDGAEFWYQTKSARLRITPISKRRHQELGRIQITGTTSNRDIQLPSGFEYYETGHYEDFFFDDVFWGRVHYVEDQVCYSVMNKARSRKSYGTNSFYYLLDRFLNRYEYLYITDYFEQFSYKDQLPGFEYWDGQRWNNNFTN